MKKAKQMLSVLLALIMIFSIIPISASAASLFDQRVSQLRKMFPNNGYWNHAVYDYNQRGDVLLANWDNTYGDYTSGTPCATHNGQPGYGQFDCNVFDGGMQCWGFANRIFYGIFGVYASNVGQRWDTQNVQKGDWIRLENENHSAVVLARNGNTLTIVEGNRDGNCKIVWDRQVSLSSVNWFKHCPEPTYTSVTSNLTSANLGDDFYAYIAKKDAGKNLESSEEKTQQQQDAQYNHGNVQLAKDGNDNSDPRQVWHFLRQSDGSYKIKNEYNNSLMDVYSSLSDDGTNVITSSDDHNGGNQRWYLFGASGGYRFSPVFASYKALDVRGNSNANGTNVVIWDANDTAAQIFSISKVSYSKPAKPAASTISVSSLGLPGKTTTLTWTASALKDKKFDSRSYILIMSTGGVSIAGLTETSINLTLSKGTYTAKIRAVNTKYPNYYTDGPTVTFTVKDCTTHTWNSGTVTKEASCTEAGVMTYTCTVNGCGATKTEPISALDHTAPDANGNCTRCGRHIADVGKPTNPDAPTDPAGQSQPSGTCRYCGGTHSGFPGVIIGFFHSILALFGLRK